MGQIRSFVGPMIQFFGLNEITYKPNEVTLPPYWFLLHRIYNGCIIETSFCWPTQGCLSAKTLPIFFSLWLSRFLQYLGFPCIDFAQILMKQHLFSICFAVVKTASFYLYSLLNDNENKITCQRAFLQQPVTIKRHVHEDAEKGSWGRGA